MNRSIILSFSFLFAILFSGCLDSSTSSYDDAEDLAFLEEYAQKEGVTTTESGLMYRVIEEGEGERPADDHYSIVEYDGESLDTKHQISTDPEQTQNGPGFDIIIPSQMRSFIGIAEGVQLMREGAKYEFVLPTELATGDGRVFLIELQLNSFIQEDQEQFLEDNAELEDIEVTPSGLQYRIIEEGEGDSPNAASVVNVKYKATYTNGYVIDQSPEEETQEINLSEVIEGFREGLQLMNEGAKYEFFIRPQLGYGSYAPQFGIVVIRYEVELLEIQ